MLLNVRSLLAERLQVDESRLPFVGELLEVRAAERAGVGRSSGCSGRSPARWSSRMRTTVLPPRSSTKRTCTLAWFTNGCFRATCQRERSRRPALARPQTGTGRWPVQRLAVERLCNRYDYACVDHPDGFAGVRRAVTINGQMKHSEYRHEDDRSRLNDRANWVLGFTTGARRRPSWRPG